MTKEEIYEAIGYTGKYTKEVKRKLRLLMKRFHPDVNAGDDSTMKILVEVKNELTHNKVSYTRSKKTVEKETPIKQTPQESEETDDFQRFSVGDLTKKVQELLKKLDAFTQNLFALYKRLSKEESKRVELDRAYRENMDAMQIFKEQLYRVVHISKWEIFLLILIVCNIGMLFLRFHLAFILSLFFLAFIYIVIVLSRNLKLNKIQDALYTLEIDELILKKQLDQQNQVIKEFHVKEGSIKRALQKLKDDITFYNHIIAKRTNKTKTQEYERTTSYTKRK